MSSLLEAANASTNKFIIGALPTNPGDVSIMTLEQIYTALDGWPSDSFRTDPSSRYDTSTFYIYAIFAGFGDTGITTGSTSTQLQSINLNWYKHLNKPTTATRTWISQKSKLFGGPLFDIRQYGRYYSFRWWYNNHKDFCSDYHWHGAVDASVYVAVVRAR